jgi:hypothetical protein
LISSLNELLSGFNSPKLKQGVECHINVLYHQRDGYSIKAAVAHWIKPLMEIMRHDGCRSGFMSINLRTSIHFGSYSMKKKLIIFIILPVILVLGFLAGFVVLSEKAGHPDFEGVWTYTLGAHEFESIIADKSTIAIFTDFPGRAIGKLNISINTIDEKAHHILGTISSGTGVYEKAKGSIYITYKIDGSIACFSSSSKDYPADISACTTLYSK